ncbi:DM13 domain-containing protein [Terrimonas pollutisoli]|uniref:DM13 domain-containing protein n=1 Tax=Terrimonas pollutisoli TaxID=3034147 RepID=UPI0023ED053A|nr:DM13 domain-containing protein [Terrimonas sp. H1YJ31]
MKQFIYFFACTVLFITGCKKETTSTTPLNETPGTAAMAIDCGSFSNGPYGSVSGKAKIYKPGDNYELALENFSSSNGPDLKVYLSKEKQPVNFVNLGSLKSTSGNQVYPIPSSVNIKDYSFALIHCQQYNHLFGFAQLKQ